MRLLYISGKRARERELLKRAEGVSFREVRLHLREGLGAGLAGKLALSVRTMRSFRPDVILVEWLGPSALLALALGRAFGVPVVLRMKGDIWMEHREPGHSVPLRERLARAINYRTAKAALGRADMVLPVSEGLAGRIRENVGDPPPCRVVHIPYVEPVKGRGGAAPGKGYVLTVTNFNFWGKVAPLAGAMPAVYPSLERLGLEWLIIGDGLFLDRCKAASEGYKDRIKFLGMQDAQAYYGGPALMLLYISGMDGLPNVLLEAWANRVPVVMNADCPAAEFIEDGKDGLLADAGDPVGIGRVIEGLAHDEARRGALAEEGYTHVKDAFSIDKVSADLKGALEDCLAK